MPLTPLAARYDQFIVDLDGCVWVGDQPTAGVQDALQALRDGGKGVAFATNDPRAPTEDYVTRLWGIGVQASLRDVVTVGGALQHRLAETRQGRTAFVIGTPSLKKHVADAGLRLLNGTDLASRAEVVIVAGTEDFTYNDLRNAGLAVRRGADFVATGRDPTYPQPDGFWPGTGAILAAVETVSERKAEIVGKPNPQLILTALDRLGDGRTLVVGDRADADLAAAAGAELDAALVKTGGQDETDAATADPAPVAVAESLAALIMR